jgi:hypothetical protein
MHLGKIIKGRILYMKRVETHLLGEKGKFVFIYYGKNPLKVGRPVLFSS